jgi:hypothetical protein
MPLLQAVTAGERRQKAVTYVQPAHREKAGPRYNRQLHSLKYKPLKIVNG